MNVIFITIAVIGATIGACVGYAIASFVDFNLYGGILIGALLGTVSPFTGGEI